MPAGTGQHFAGGEGEEEREGERGEDVGEELRKGRKRRRTKRRSRREERNVSKGCKNRASDSAKRKKKVIIIKGR